MIPLLLAGGLPMYACKGLGAIILCLSTTLAQGAGIRAIDIPAGADGPALKGAVWYPCSQPPGEADFGKITLPGVKDCPLPDKKLPLIVVSHGRRGNFIGHYDTVEVLADAGFAVAAINHPGDTALDLSRTDDLVIYLQRPNDIKRLIDFMVGASALASNIDRERIGLFGFSRGGYTGLAVIGANPDWANATALCQQSTTHVCEQIRAKEFPVQAVTHDPRIKAAVIADPLTVFFTADSFGAVGIPVQLWASERGGDGVLPHTADVVDRNLPSAHEYQIVSNAEHFAFLGPCPPALAKEVPQICADATDFDRVAFHRQFNADVLAFLRTHLTNAPR
jgi:predicted dienelactone hydrolase